MNESVCTYSTRTENRSIQCFSGLVMVLRTVWTREHVEQQAVVREKLMNMKN